MGAEQSHQLENIEVGANACADISELYEITRPEPYSLPADHHYHAVAVLGAHRGEGWGSGPLLKAKEKAKSEALERLAFSIKSNSSNANSNGWAAHYTLDLALKAAVSELVERQVALQTWLNAGAYWVVPIDLWPSELVYWHQHLSLGAEYNDLTVAISSWQSLCCVTVLLRSKSGSLLAAHSSGIDLKECISSAFNEALRSVHGVLRFDGFKQVMELHSDGKRRLDPEANAYAYAYGHRIPDLDIRISNSEVILEKWLRHARRLNEEIISAEVLSYKIKDRFVVHAKKREFLPMFWGRTSSTLKFNNLNPHFVG